MRMERGPFQETRGAKWSGSLSPMACGMVEAATRSAPGWVVPVGARGEPSAATPNSGLSTAHACTHNLQCKVFCIIDLDTLKSHRWEELILPKLYRRGHTNKIEHA